MKIVLLYFFASLLHFARHNLPVGTHVVRCITVQANYPGFKFDTTLAQNLSDSLFLVTAYNQNEFEIKAAKLAHKQSGNPKVKDMALVIKKDHEALSNNLQALLIKKGYTLPQPSTELQAKFKYLNEWMGKDFNTRYANGNAIDTEGDIAFYTLFLRSTKDAELRGFATNAITVLQVDKDSMEELIKHINVVPRSTW